MTNANLALRQNKTRRKLRLLVSLAVFSMQVCVAGLVGADITTQIASALNPSLEWHCSSVKNEQLGAKESRKANWGVCRFRGGSVDSEIDTVDKASSSPQTMVEDYNSTSLMSPSSSQDDIDLFSNFTFSMFQRGDGSETDSQGIPRRYLKMQNDKRDQAYAALKSTLEWRSANDIDTILARPHPKYDVCKAVFPHYFCGRDDSGHVILVQRPGLIDLDLAHKNNLTGDDLLMHYVYVMEYLWNVIEPRPDETMTSIIDLKGISLSILGKPELIRIVQKFCTTMDNHFPQRSHKTLLINAPKWFGGMYKLISPLLRESTREKIAILSKGSKQDEALRKLLTECSIPDNKEDMDAMPPAHMEEEMRQFCLARLDEADSKMEKFTMV